MHNATGGPAHNGHAYTQVSSSEGRRAQRRGGQRAMAGQCGGGEARRAHGKGPSCSNCARCASCGCGTTLVTVSSPGRVIIKPATPAAGRTGVYPWAKESISGLRNKHARSSWAMDGRAARVQAARRVKPPRVQVIRPRLRRSASSRRAGCRLEKRAGSADVLLLRTSALRWHRRRRERVQAIASTAAAKVRTGVAVPAQWLRKYGPVWKIRLAAWKPKGVNCQA